MRVFDWSISSYIVGKIKKKKKKKAWRMLVRVCELPHMRYFRLFSLNAIPYTMFVSPPVECYVNWTVTPTMRPKLFVYCNEICWWADEIHWTKWMHIVDYLWIIKMLHVILKSVEVLELLRRKKILFLTILCMWRGRWTNRSACACCVR